MGGLKGGFGPRGGKEGGTSRSLTCFFPFKVCSTGFVVTKAADDLSSKDVEGGLGTEGKY